MTTSDVITKKCVMTFEVDEIVSWPVYFQQSPPGIRKIINDVDGFNDRNLIPLSI